MVSAPYMADDDAPPNLLQLFEYVLSCTGKVLRDRGVVPKNETDIQRAMNSHLECVFQDYTKTVTIAKSIKSFKPDGGVVPLRAAVEFKFAASEAEAQRAISGISKDATGYSGSLDWVRFYSVVYMTENFTSPTRFERALQLSGCAGAWTCITLVGPGERLEKGPRG
jgi:hypothetical protein